MAYTVGGGSSYPKYVFNANPEFGNTVVIPDSLALTGTLSNTGQRGDSTVIRRCDVSVYVRIGSSGLTYNPSGSGFPKSFTVSCAVQKSVALNMSFDLHALRECLRTWSGAAAATAKTQIEPLSTQPNFWFVLSFCDVWGSTDVPLGEFNLGPNGNYNFGVWYLRIADMAAPTISSAEPADRAQTDALEVFGGYALNHSVPVFNSAFALSPFYPKLTASHSLALSGAMSATLTASTAAGVAEQAFQLPAPTAAGTVTWTYTITDSYGGTATATGSFAVLNYSPPGFVSMAPERYAVVLDQGESSHVPADYGTWLWLSYSAAVCAITGPGGEHNPWTLTAAWAPDIGSGGGSQLIESDADGRVLSATRDESVTAELSASSGWVVRLILEDALQSASIEVLLQPGHALFDIEPHGVAVGMHSTGTDSAKRFEVADDYEAHFFGGIRGVTNYASGEELTGGTWIDGKPIYRYVFTGSTTLSGSITIGTLPRTPGAILDYRLMIQNRYGHWMPAGFSGGTNTGAYQYRLDSYITSANAITLVINSGYAGGTTRFWGVVEYTAAT